MFLKKKEFALHSYVKNWDPERCRWLEEGGGIPLVDFFETGAGGTSTKHF